jgi:nucleotide-binding universal stress UspA family protein
MDQIRKTAADIAASAATSLDVPSKAIGLIGEPSAEIIKYASDHDTHYIVVGPHKQSPTGKAIFGSTAQQILLNAEHPVVSTVLG